MTKFWFSEEKLTWCLNTVYLKIWVKNITLKKWYIKISSNIGLYVCQRKLELLTVVEALNDASLNMLLTVVLKQMLFMHCIQKQLYDNIYFEITHVGTCIWNMRHKSPEYLEDTVVKHS